MPWALRRLPDWLYPRGANCLCCGDPRRADPGDCLCEQCKNALAKRRVPPQACDRCLSPVGKHEKCAFCASPMMAPLERVFAPYRYGGEVRQLVHAFKFNACGEALPLMARAMENALTVRDYDCIVPVPLHLRRLRQRGFNQALLLSRDLSVRTGIPVREWLERKTYIKPQSKTRIGRRAENVARAFCASPDCRGKRVLLVDDVRTSGSTAWACAQALRKAGAASVSLWVFAVVYRRK